MRLHRDVRMSLEMVRKLTVRPKPSKYIKINIKVVTSTHLGGGGVKQRDQEHFKSKKRFASQHPPLHQLSALNSSPRRTASLPFSPGLGFDSYSHPSRDKVEFLGPLDDCGAAMTASHVLDGYYLAVTLLVTIAYQLFWFSIAFTLRFDKLTG